MNKYTPFLLSISLIAAGCGGGGGDDPKGDNGGDNPNRPGSFNISGDFPELPSSSTWQVTTDLGTDSCGYPFGGVTYEVTIDFSEDKKAVAIVIETGGVTVSNLNITSSDTNSFTVSGKVESDDGVTTISDLNFDFGYIEDFVEDLTPISGSVSWSWSDGEETCDGSTTLDGNLLQFTGEVVVPDPDPIDDLDPIALGSISYQIGGVKGTTDVGAAYFIDGNTAWVSSADYLNSEGNQDSDITSAIYLVINPYNGPGNYSADSENQSIQLAYVRSVYDAGGGDVYPVNYQYCVDVDDEDNPNNDAFLNVTISQSGDTYTGLLTGKLNCFDFNYTNGGESYSGLKDVSIKFTTKEISSPDQLAID